MPQDPDFDYSKVPSDYIHCFNHQCPRAAQCLRHLAGQYVPAGVPVVRCVNPSACSGDAGKCPYYCTTQKVTLAWGLKNLAEDVPYQQAIAIRRAVRRLWPHTSYARMQHHERPILPERQEEIERIFAKYAPGKHATYDYLTEEYDFWQ